MNILYIPGCFSLWFVSSGKHVGKPYTKGRDLVVNVINQGTMRPAGGMTGMGVPSHMKYIGVISHKKYIEVSTY